MIKIVNEERYMKFIKSVQASTDSPRKRDTLHAIKLINESFHSIKRVKNINLLIYASIVKLNTYDFNTKNYIDLIINDFFGEYND